MRGLQIGGLCICIHKEAQDFTDLDLNLQRVEYRQMSEQEPKIKEILLIYVTHVAVTCDMQNQLGFP